MADDPGTARIIAFPTAPSPDRVQANGVDEPKVRHAIGAVLRDERAEQERTLADVAETAAVSVAYLSEIERGRKEVSSDLLAAVCGALEIEVPDVLELAADRLRGWGDRRPNMSLLAA